MKSKLFPLVAVSVLLSGCVVITHEGNGTKTTYIAPAFGTKSIAAADLQKGKIEGYRSEQSQMAEAIAAGVAAGMANK
jgi:hypothetical protein